MNLSQSSKEENVYLIKDNYLNSIKVARRELSNPDICFDIIDRVYNWFHNDEDIFNDEPFVSDSRFDDEKILETYNSFLYDLSSAMSSAVIRFDPASKFRKFMHSDDRHKYTKERCETIIEECEFILDKLSEHIDQLLDEAYCTDAYAEVIENKLYYEMQKCIDKMKFNYDYL